jgi:two-component system sensor histidine kinase RpfC
VAFGTPPVPINRSGAVHAAYTSGVNAPWDARTVNRAIHFAAIDEITSRARAAQWERRHPFEGGDHRPRVLVAEDNATNRKIIAQVLEHGGFDVTLATTGTQAVGALCDAEFDVVILDKFMPGMSGMEVAERYREKRGDGAAPMIMLTAEATAEAMQQCKDAGMQAFLTKPIDPEMLFETISALTGARASFPRGASAFPTETRAPKILDESVLLELDKHAYSPQFLTDIVESFESDMQDLIDRLAVSIERNDWSELPDLRHTIEGTARGSGALKIAESVSQLKLLPELTSDDRRAQLAVLKQSFAETLGAMRRLVEGRTSTV